MRLIVLLFATLSFYYLSSCNNSTVRVVADPKVNSIQLADTTSGSELIALQAAQRFCSGRGKQYVRRFAVSNDELELKFKCL